MAELPALTGFIDSTPWMTCHAPTIAPRAWALGVIAVQLTVANGKIHGQLRAHVTGGTAATLVPLSPPVVIHVALESAPSQTPAVQLPSLPAPDGNGLTVYLDGVRLGHCTLDPGRSDEPIPPRAFGHVYCRWLRDGTVEPGFDLTAFRPHPPGAKVPRLLHRPLAVGSVVSYAFACSGRPLFATLAK